MAAGVRFLAAAAKTRRVSARTFTSSVPPAASSASSSEAELCLYRGLKDQEASLAAKLKKAREENGVLQKNHKDLLENFEKSLTKARDEVRETATVSVIFVAGLVSSGIAGLYLARPKDADKEALAKAAAEAAAKVAAEAAAKAAADAVAKAVVEATAKAAADQAAKAKD